MGKIGFVFAGQGAQYTGMGESLSKCSSAAAELFKKIDSVRPETSKQCFEADAEQLMKTDVTQPCVYAVDLACDENYKLVRNFSFVIAKDESEAADDFIDWVLSAKGQQAVEAAGYVPIK